MRSGSESDETVVAEGSHSESSVEATMCAGTALPPTAVADETIAQRRKAQSAEPAVVAQVCRVMLTPSLAIRGQRQAKQSGKNAAPSRPRMATILRSRGYMRRGIRSQKWAT